MLAMLEKVFSLLRPQIAPCNRMLTAPRTTKLFRMMFSEREANLVFPFEPLFDFSPITWRLRTRCYGGVKSLIH